MVKELPLTKGYVALVDDADFDDLSRFRWQAVSIQQKIGLRIKVRRTYRTPETGRKSLNLELGRYLLGIVDRPEVEVDHADGNSLNFQRSNLRIATPTQNLANRRKSTLSASPYKGIYFHKSSGKWAAAAKRHGKVFRLGYFATPEDAALAYDNAARQLHGEFARVNFPGPHERSA